ncbi:MAG: thioredoxin family protein [Phycisphaerales bacterium]
MKKSAARWFTGVVASVVALAGVTMFATDAEAQRSRSAMDNAPAKVGEKAPTFTLTDINGNEVSIQDHIDDGKIVVLEWWNPKCPYVVKHHEKMTTMVDLATKYEDEVAWIKINSTNPSHRDHGVDKDYAQKWNLEDYTILLDEDGTVGKMYGARVTPHMYIIDTEGVLRYQGAIDSNRGAGAYSESEKSQVTNYVDQALQQIIAGETVSRPETRPYGCGVKYPG